MYDRRAFAVIAATSTLLPSSLRAEANDSARATEAAALIDFAERTHPKGLEAKADPKWRDLGIRLGESARRAPIAEYVVRACALLAWFKDGHTTIRANRITEGPFGLDTPVRVAPFYDGLYIVEAVPTLSDLLGARVSKVGALPVEELIQRFAAVWPSNNPAWVQHDAGILFNTPGFLHGLGVVDGPDAAALTIEAAPEGRAPRAHQLAPGKSVASEALKRTPSAIDAWAAESGSKNFVRRLSERDTLYVSLDDVDQPVDRFMAFTREVLAAMNEPRWSRLVIDLRRNPGGNNFLAEPLRKEIERSRFNRPGALYVLIGPVTFSAAQNLANRLERETFAVFAGEPSGGAPNHYGDARPFEGGAGLKAAVSTIPWFDSYPMDRRPWVMPDLLIPRTFSDWANGRDRVLEAVLAEPQPASDSAPPADRTFFFARKSQSAQWRPFWLDTVGAASRPDTP